MTDTSFPVKPIDGYDLSRAPLFHPAPHQQRYHAPAANGDPGDDGQISCICDFADDDGYTVQCDKCHRWQHQSCYYPEYDERQLPESLEHCCVDCVPKHVDVQAARRRQMAKRGHTEPHANGIKRAASKSHKKKPKEPGQPYSNGWPADKLRHDRNSASPRDQPPPAKRPKTSHRTSDSTTATSVKGHSRKRNVSSVNNLRSLSPIERYSPNFLRLYMDDDWSLAENNLHDSIAVTNSLTKWVEMPDDEFKVVHGHAKGEVLMRYDGSLDDVPGKAVYSIAEQRDDDVQGHPVYWKTIVVEEPLLKGAYIGELKGRICFKQDYQDDSANRWNELEHPEPFVFFHSKLPIALDARSEGTDLRFIRRSCNPNARLQILITAEKDYHFCFLATENIEPGQEIAIAWETGDLMPDISRSVKPNPAQLASLSTWASVALANCGPCACGMPTTRCHLARLDRRLDHNGEQPVKGAKSKKRKNGQNGQEPSPLNTNAVNSCSGSEVLRNEPEDDVTDSQSASGSAGRGSASRDITPNTHYSTNGTGMPELSEREKKKMAKEEEMFRRQEEEITGKQAKKKRNSGGSNLNTPSATSSKQPGFPASASSKHCDANTARPTGQSFVKATQARKSRSQKSLMMPPSRVLQQPRPVLVDAGTQCDLDIEEATRRVPTPSSRKPYRSLRQTLLDRCARSNQAILASAPSSPKSVRQPSLAPGDAMDVDKPSVKEPNSLVLTERPRSSGSSASSANAHPGDTEMADVDDVDSSDQASATADVRKVRSSTSEDHGNSSRKSSSTEPSSAPLWSTKSTTAGPAASEQPVAKPATDMPPPSLNSIASCTAAFSAGMHITTTGSTARSPVSTTPGSMFPPKVAATVMPSPMKKKLSLSDYTRRRAKKEDSDIGHGESSPSSVVSGPVMAPLQASSSTEVRAAQGNAIEEDVKMEEAEHVQATLTAA